VCSSDLSQGLEYQGEGKNPVDFVGFMADTTKIMRDSTLLAKPGATPVTMYVFFKPDVQQDDMVNWMSNPYQPYERKLKNYLAAQSEFFYDSPLSPASYSFAKQENNFVARVHLIGIARHPAQLYESISCLILFVFMLWYWNKYKNALPEGRLFGLFMTILWSLRFSYEFIKENQETFENELPLNMGQLLSIPLFIAGLIILRRSYKKPASR
jgi:prolipoprotein diacylglyceryltransferase